VRRTVLVVGAALTLLSLGACYTLVIPPPQLAYDDKSVAHSETAVIMKDPSPDGVHVSIASVNGRNMACLAQGCPLWARVLPGTATITVKVLYVPSLSKAYRDIGDIQLTVDAQPRHTYLVAYKLDTGSETVRAVIVDAGVNYEGKFKARGREFGPTFD
jgi:hypothetical protein